MRKVFILLITLSTGACCCDKEKMSIKETIPTADVAPVEYAVQNKAVLDLRVKSTQLAKPAVQEKATAFSGYVDSESGSSVVAYIPVDQLYEFVKALDSDVGTVKNFKNAGSNIDFTTIQSDAKKNVSPENAYSYVYIWLDDRNLMLRAFMSPMATIFGL